MLSKKEIETILDQLEKGKKAAPIGEVRTWSGQKYVKHADGWVHIHPITGKVTVLPTSGPIRKFDGEDHHWAHYLYHVEEKPKFESTKEKKSELLTEKKVKERLNQEVVKDSKEKLEEIYAHKKTPDTNKFKGSIRYQYAPTDNSVGKTESGKEVFKNKPGYRYNLFDQKDHEDAKAIHLIQSDIAKKAMVTETNPENLANLKYRSEMHRDMADTHQNIIDQKYSNKKEPENPLVEKNTVLKEKATEKKQTQEETLGNYFGNLNYDKETPKLNQHYGKAYLDMIKNSDKLNDKEKIDLSTDSLLGQTSSKKSIPELGFLERPENFSKRDHQDASELCHKRIVSLKKLPQTKEIKDKINALTVQANKYLLWSQHPFLANETHINHPLGKYKNKAID